MNIVLEDIVSACLIGFVMYPFLRLLHTMSCYNVRYVIGLLCVVAFIKVAHSLPPKGVLARPKGACDCSILNNGGNYELRGGMPSGHVMITSFVMFMMALESHEWYTYVSSVCIVIAMGISRIAKGCHTLPQTIAGGILGFISAYVTTFM